MIFLTAQLLIFLGQKSITTKKLLLSTELDRSFSVRKTFFFAFCQKIPITKAVKHHNRLRVINYMVFKKAQII